MWAPRRLSKLCGMGAGSKTLDDIDQFILLQLYLTNPARSLKSYVENILVLTGTEVSTSTVSKWFLTSFPGFESDIIDPITLALVVRRCSLLLKPMQVVRSIIGFRRDTTPSCDQGIALLNCWDVGPGCHWHHCSEIDVFLFREQSERKFGRRRGVRGHSCARRIIRYSTCTVTVDLHTCATNP